MIMAGHGLLESVREAFLGLLGLIIAWTTLAPTVEVFRKNQLANVKSGVSTILNIQAWRHPVLDRVLSAITFCGEEDFYLFATPFLFWNIDHKLGTQFNNVVCAGIFGGNFVKDMFRVPRPPSPPVWVAPNLLHSDSTGLRDFGFPSTHSLNALSNPAYLLMWALATGRLTTGAPLELAAWVLLGAAYCAVLAGSRMYLGVHSPGDVRAGLFMGLLLVSIQGSVGEWLYAWILRGEHMGAVSVAATVFMILMCPQVRPRTPTFVMNCSLLGLLLGCVLGTRWWHDRVLVAETQALLAPLAVSPATYEAHLAGWAGVALRMVVGVAITMGVRVVLKLLLNPALSRVCGVPLFASAAAGTGGTDDVHESSLVVSLEAVSKTTVYTGLAAAVTWLSPMVHEALGIASVAAI